MMIRSFLFNIFNFYVVVSFLTNFIKVGSIKFFLTLKYVCLASKLKVESIEVKHQILFLIGISQANIFLDWNFSG